MSTSPDTADQQSPERGETPESSPLTAVFPGEAVDCPSIGRLVVVRPWGGEELAHEVPALLGRMAAKVAPLARQLQALRAGGDVEPEAMALLFQAIGREVFDLVCWTGKVTSAERQQLSAADTLRLMRAGLRQNADFFGEAGGLYDELRGLARGGSSS
ncbi:MAG: hypothetical protein QN174_07805 [Armatimonadota bacterium]|nr:hypothetical protein [Armatimonadota bacterium]